MPFEKFERPPEIKPEGRENLEESSERKFEERAPESEISGLENEKTWLEKLKERFSSVFSREREKKPFLPNMSIKIFYSPHGGLEDFKRFKEEFQQADIFIPEIVRWNEESLESLRRISEGESEPSPFLILDAPARWTEMELLYNSRKPVTLIDVPKGHPIERRTEQALSHRDENLSFFNLCHDDFDKLLKSYRDFIQEFENGQKEREEYMISQLAPKIEELLKQNPELSKKKTLKALIQLGAAHTHVFHALREKGAKVDRVFSETPFIFDHGVEVARRYRFGKEVPDKLVARALLERLLVYMTGPSLRNIVKDSQDVSRLHRKMASRFSLEEVKEIFAHLRPMYEDFKKAKAKHIGEIFNPYFNGELKKRGLKIPQSKKEAEEMLANERS